jgi:class 3 adenylate cyclase/tetratricopeptide (TPR) repeat protein
LFCSSCRATAEAGALACRRCGTPLELTCPTCGRANPWDARFCNLCGNRLAEAAAGTAGAAELGRLALAEERRSITILFADLVGFTPLAERLDPEDARELTAITLGRLAREVTTYGGTIDKFLGDALLALFGAPVAHEDDAERAVGAALAMQRAMDEVNDSLAAYSGGKLAIRVGVNTGEVVVGARDVGGRVEFTAIGDPVNIAARLQSAAEAGGILVGEHTRREASRAYRFEPVAPLHLKGKQDRVEAYRVVGSREQVLEGPLPGERAITAPLVGRDPELASLRYCLDQLLRGKGQIAWVVGAGGIGKTRLLAELRREYAGRRLRWAQARGQSYTEGISYGIFRGAVAQLVGLDAAAPPASRLEVLRAELAALGAPEALPFLAHQLGIELDPFIRAELDRLAPEAFRARVAAAIRRWLMALARRQPCVLVVDDLHWADASSVDLLDALIDLADEAPIFFCFLTRPESNPRVWAVRERAARELPERFSALELDPLAIDEATLLVGHLLGSGRPPPQLVARIQAAAQGNPLYLEEVVRDLVERGLLRQSNQGWVESEPLHQLHVPESIQNAIMARIDRAPAPLRQLLQTASVIGREFPRSLLSAVAQDPDGIETLLSEAERLELLVSLDGSEQTYAFRHPLVHEAIYQAQLQRRRREQHQLTLEALERLAPTPNGDQLSALAHHAWAAEDWRRIARYSPLEAEHSYALRAYQEAFDQLVRASRSLDHVVVEPEQALAIVERQGDLEVLLGRPEAARASFERALRLLEATNEGAGRRGGLHLKLARVARELYEPDSAAEHLARAEGELPAHDREISGLYSLRAWLAAWQSDYQAAVGFARRALDLACASGDSDQINLAYRGLAQPALAGQPDLDLRSLTAEWVAGARSHGDRPALVLALCTRALMLTWVYGESGPIVTQLAEEAHELGEQEGGASSALGSRILGGCLLAEGRWDDARSALQRGLERGDRSDAFAQYASFWLAELLTSQGSPERAVEILERAEAGRANPHAQIWLQLGLASARLAQADPVAARAALDAGHQAALAQRCPSCGLIFFAAAAELWLDLDLPVRAAAALTRARELEPMIGRPVSRLAANRAAARLSVLEGRAEAAVGALEAALQLSASVGQPLEVARTEAALGWALLNCEAREAAGRARHHLRRAQALLRPLDASGELERVRRLASSRPRVLAESLARAPDSAVP